MSDLKKILNHLKQLGADPEIAPYVERNITVAREILKGAQAVAGGAPFHDWKQGVLAQLADRLGDGKSVWQAVTVQIAFEEFKALRARGFFGKIWSWFSKAWQWVGRVGLDGFIKAQVQPLLNELPRILDVRSNSDLKAIEQDLWNLLDKKKKEVAGNWKSLAVQAVLLIAQRKGIVIEN